MNTINMDFFTSAIASEGTSLPSFSVPDWFSSRQEVHRFSLEQIPFSKLEKWSFDPVNGNLCHESGRFFSIEAIRVKTNWGSIPEWDQPIINQPEIGFLGEEHLTKNTHFFETQSV